MRATAFKHLHRAIRHMPIVVMFLPMLVFSYVATEVIELDNVTLSLGFVVGSAMYAWNDYVRGVRRRQIKDDVERIVGPETAKTVLQRFP